MNWLPLRDSKADVSRVSPSSEPIRRSEFEEVCLIACNVFNKGKKVFQKLKDMFELLLV